MPPLTPGTPGGVAVTGGKGGRISGVGGMPRTPLSAGGGAFAIAGGCALCANICASEDLPLACGMFSLTTAMLITLCWLVGRAF
jgi:hypothetical protein